MLGVAEHVIFHYHKWAHEQLFGLLIEVELARCVQLLKNILDEKLRLGANICSAVESIQVHLSATCKYNDSNDTLNVHLTLLTSAE